jgi:hypothetical protein
MKKIQASTQIHHKKQLRKWPFNNLLKRKSKFLRQVSLEVEVRIEHLNSIDSQLSISSKKDHCSRNSQIRWWKSKSGQVMQSLHFLISKKEIPRSYHGSPQQLSQLRKVQFLMHQKTSRLSLTDVKDIWPMINIKPIGKQWITPRG